MMEYQIPALSQDGQSIVIILLFIGLLLGVYLIGYFMQKAGKTQEKSIQDQQGYLQALKEAVDELAMAVHGLKQFNDIFLPRMEERLNRQSAKIAHIDERLTGVETEHKLLCCQPQNSRKTKMR